MITLVGRCAVCPGGTWCLDLLGHLRDQHEASFGAGPALRDGQLVAFDHHLQPVPSALIPSPREGDR